MSTIDSIVKTNQFSKLKNKLLISSLTGDYKEYKKTMKTLASKGIEDFDYFVKSPSINVKGNIPIFTKTGLKVLKVLILNACRIKTKDERKFKQLQKAYKRKLEFTDKIKQKIESTIRSEIDRDVKAKADKIIQDKTEMLAKTISQYQIDELFKEIQNYKSHNTNSLIDTALKEIPRKLLRQEAEIAKNQIYNPKLLNK